MSLRTATCNLLSHAVACCDKANKVRVIRKRFNIKVCTNDSIGAFSPGLYILYLLKLPAPPRADLSGIMGGSMSSLIVVRHDVRSAAGA